MSSMPFPSSARWPLWQVFALVVGLVIAASAVGAQDDASGEGSSESFVATITLKVGRTRVVQTPNVDRVALGTSGLVDVRPFPEIGQILLIGQEAGETDLRVWNNDGEYVRYRLRVDGGEPESEAEAETVSAVQVQKLFADVAGVRVVELDDGRLAIQGQARREIDHERARGLAQRFDAVVNQVDKPSLTRESTVLIEARILEVRRNDLERIGINWENTVNGPIFAWLADWKTNDVFRPEQPDDLTITGGSGSNQLPADVGTNVFSGWQGSWQSTINLLREDGVARLLAEPRLTTVNGEEASFQSGGEVPVQTTTPDGEPVVEFKDFGISLDIKPQANAQGLIRTEVNVEVSSLDQSIAVNGQPGLTTRNTETVMNAREGRPMVVSGLFNQQEGKDVDAVPGLSRIPLLGELFKSRSFRNRRTELVIIVTPYLVTPDSPRMNKLKERAADMESEEMDEELTYSIFD